MWTMINSIIVLVAAVLLLFNSKRMWKVVLAVAEAQKDNAETMNKVSEGALEASRRLSEQMVLLLSQVEHLYAVVSMLPLPLPARMLLERGPKGLPRTDDEKRKFMWEIHSESYKIIRGRLLHAIEGAEDSVEKDRLKKLLDETDGVYNLIGTLDEKSSPDYVQQVMSEIPASIQRITEALNDYE